MANEDVAGVGRLTRSRERTVRARLGAVRRRETGQAVVELAIVVPLIMLIVLGIVDFGLAYNYKNDQTSLANQALRYGEVNKCDDCGPLSVEEYVKSTADSGELRNGNSPGSFGIQQPGVTISFCRPTGSGGTVGEALEAKATSTYNWLPFLHLANVTIESTAIGRIEQGRSSPDTTNAYARFGLGPC
jgi:hypothetical protein